jgi:hypothetical protein
MSENEKTELQILRIECNYLHHKLNQLFHEIKVQNSKNNSKRNAKACSGPTKDFANMGREIMLTCRISMEMMKTLNDLSTKTGITRSDVLRSFIAEGLQKKSRHLL